MKQTKMETDANKLYKKASRWEKLTQDELNYVLSVNNAPEEDLYLLLRTLGKVGVLEYKPEYRPIVERYLIYPKDTMVSALALEILCDFWGFTADYLPQIKQFIDAVEWDKYIDGGYKDVRRMAISIAGRYLNKNRDLELLRKLYSIFIHDNNPLQREFAYLALADAVRGRAKEITYPHGHHDFIHKIDESKVDKSIIEAVERRLALEAKDE